jgi:hypothetical protein
MKRLKLDEKNILNEEGEVWYSHCLIIDINSFKLRDLYKLIFTRLILFYEQLISYLHSQKVLNEGIELETHKKVKAYVFFYI